MSTPRSGCSRPALRPPVRLRTKLKEVEELQGELARLKAQHRQFRHRQLCQGQSARGVRRQPVSRYPGPQTPTSSQAPDTGKATPGNEQAPPKESPRALEDMDYLEPPQAGAAGRTRRWASRASQRRGASGREPAEQSDAPITPPGKLASRWTPRRCVAPTAAQTPQCRR